jgi:PleD family two-component response regulator
VVHRIITSHEGTVRVYSEPGKGTAFPVYFPAITSAVETREAIPQPLVAGSGQRIPFVDDEALLVSTGKAALERNGYHILGSIGAEDALKEFQASPGAFGVVITDFSMPAMICSV